MGLGRDDEPDGLRRTWAGLCRCLCRPRPGTVWEEIERPEQLCVRGNKTADDVSYASNEVFEHPIGDDFDSGLWRRSKRR